MNPNALPRRLDTTELSRLHDAALQRAGRQRDAAIDAFWRGAAAALRARLSKAHAAAARLARRLPRHMPQQRPAGSAR